MLSAFAAALDYIENLGIEMIRAHEAVLTQQLLEGLRRIPGLKIYPAIRIMRMTEAESCHLILRGRALWQLLFIWTAAELLFVQERTVPSRSRWTYLGAAATCRVSLSPYNTEERLRTFWIVWRKCRKR